MPYEIFLALRHLRSRQKRRLARVTSLIAVIGIAVGVAALIVVLALANGFRDEMRAKILRGTAHLTVMRSDGQAMPEYKEAAARIASVPGVIALAYPSLTSLLRKSCVFCPCAMPGNVQYWRSRNTPE